MKHHTVLLQVPDYIDIDEFTDYLDGVLFGVVRRPNGVRGPILIWSECMKVYTIILVIILVPIYLIALVAYFIAVTLAWLYFNLLNVMTHKGEYQRYKDLLDKGILYTS